MVTGGTVGSNFVPAAAAAASFAGLDCVAVMAGEAVDRAAHPNLAAATAWGAQLRWTGEAQTAPRSTRCSRRSPRQLASEGRTAVRRAARRGQRHRCPRLPAGGRRGRRPARGPETRSSRVGAGGTLAGIGGGRRRPRPARPGRRCQREQTDGRGCLPRARPRPAGRATLRRRTPAARDVEVVDARGPGHGVASAGGGRRGRGRHCACAGLVLDPVYTAKALAVLPSAAPDGPALFWHTGGLLDAVAGLLGPR